jgi:hypothetical protein
VLTLSETSNDHALCCMLNHGNTLVQLLHLPIIILLSAKPWEHPGAVATLSVVILLSAKPWAHPGAVATLAYHYPPVSSNQLFHPLHSRFCRNLNWATWSGGISCDFRTSLREFLDPVVNRFTRQTLPTVNRKHFFINILCIESSCPQKRAYRNAFLRYYAPLAILTTETSF